MPARLHRATAVALAAGFGLFALLPSPAEAAGPDVSLTVSSPAPAGILIATAPDGSFTLRAATAGSAATAVTAVVPAPPSADAVADSLPQDSAGDDTGLLIGGALAVVGAGIAVMFGLGRRSHRY